MKEPGRACPLRHAPELGATQTAAVGVYVVNLWFNILQDECVFHEEDDSFYIGISRSRSERMLYIHAGAPGATSTLRLNLWRALRVGISLLTALACWPCTCLRQGRWRPGACPAIPPKRFQTSACQLNDCRLCGDQRCAVPVRRGATRRLEAGAAARP